MKHITAIVLLFAAGLHIGCKKDQIMYNKGIESFMLVAKDAQGVETEYPGTITNEEIIVELPIEVDVTSLTSKYITDNPRTIVQIGNEVVEPGITEHDFSNPVSFTVKAEDKSKRSYHVRVEKKIALAYFGFFREDNAGIIEEDYKAVIRGLKIDISVPETIDLTKLVARFQTTAGATVKVGEVTQQSKTTVNDFSNPVVYTFNAQGLATPLDFTTAISFIGPRWWMIGDPSIIGTSAGDLSIAINPFTNQPYIAYYRSGKDESGIALEDEDKKVAVIAYDGSNWSWVGPSAGFSAGRIANTQLAFDEEGTPYVGYKDYVNSDQKATVQKYLNGNWSLVGPERFSPSRMDKFSFAIGAGNQPMLAATTLTATPGYPRRDLYVMGYNASNWTNMSPVVTNPQTGALNIFKGGNQKTYLAVLDRSSNLSMYQLEGSTWSPVGPTGFRASDGIAPFTSVLGAVDKDGVAYIAFQTVIASQRINRVMRYNGTAWVEIGSAGDSQSKSELYRLTIGPDNEVYFAYVNNSGLYTRSLNKKTNNWNTPRQVVSGNVKDFDIKVSGTGIPYLVLSSPTAGANPVDKATVYKYTATK